MASIIRNCYSRVTCRVVYGRQLTDAFQINSGVRQGCQLWPFLFLLATDWVLKTSTAQRGNGNQWTPWIHLDDLDFADDLVLFSLTQRQMQEETSTVADSSARLGLRVHRAKSKVPKNKAAVSIIPTTLEGDR